MNASRNDGWPFTVFFVVFLAVFSSLMLSWLIQREVAKRDAEQAVKQVQVEMAKYTRQIERMLK